MARCLDNSLLSSNILLHIIALTFSAYLFSVAAGVRRSYFWLFGYR